MKTSARGSTADDVKRKIGGPRIGAHVRESLCSTGPEIGMHEIGQGFANQALGILRAQQLRSGAINPGNIAPDFYAHQIRVQLHQRVIALILLWQ